LSKEGTPQGNVENLKLQNWPMSWIWWHIPPLFVIYIIKIKHHIQQQNQIFKIKVTKHVTCSKSPNAYIIGHAQYHTYKYTCPPIVKPFIYHKP
jgi:hypothetical protein